MPGSSFVRTAGGWQIPFLLLGVALYQQRSVPVAETAAVGA